MDANALRQAILARGDGFPKRMAQIASYILAHPEAVALGSVASIASAAQVAPSSLVRFGHALGLTGFADLQQVFRNELLERAIVGGGLRPVATSSKQKVGSVMDLHKKALEALTETLSEERLGQFIEVIEVAETIFIIAEGRSYPIGVALRYMFSERHVRSCLATCNESATEELVSLAGPNDAVIEIDIWPSTSSVKGNVQARLAHRAEPSNRPHRALGLATECWVSVPVSEGAETAAIALCQTVAECLVERRHRLART